MTKYTLKAEKRTIFGKKINRLRKSGILPGNLFGKNIDSQAIQVKTKDFDKIYKEAGETGIVYIQVEGEEKDRPTLITGLANNPSTGAKFHADFHQVNLKEKVTAHVPVEITGESELIKSGDAVLNQSITEIEIESLPTEIPENIIFDISVLKEIGDQLKVSDAKLPSGVEVKTDMELSVVSLAEPQKEEVVPETEETTEGVAEPATETKEGEVKEESSKE